MQVVSKTYLQKMIVPSARSFATASIRDRFEAAYVKRREDLSKGTHKAHEAEDQARYGQSYYQDKLH